MIKRSFIAFLSLVMAVSITPLKVKAEENEVEMPEETAETENGEESELLESDGQGESLNPWETIICTLNSNGGRFHLETYDGEQLYETEIRFPLQKNQLNSYIQYAEYLERDDGLLFSGWSLTADGESPVDLRTTSFDQDVVLYACYDEPISVTFHSNGTGSLVQYDSETWEAIESETITYDGLGKGQFFSPDFSLRTEEKYVGTEWNTKPDGTGESYEMEPLGYGIKNFYPTEDMDLYMIWKKAYEVSFVNYYQTEYLGDYLYRLKRLDQPEVTTELVADNGYLKNALSYFGPNYPIPKGTNKEDWLVFAGWSLKKDDINWIIADIDNYVITEDTTFYSVCATGDKAYQVTLHTNEIQFIQPGYEQEQTFLVYPGTTANTLINTNDQSDYQFENWNTKSDGSGENITTVDDFGEITPDFYLHDFVPTANIDLYAMWQKFGTYTIDANGGTIRQYINSSNNYYLPNYEWIEKETYEHGLYINVKNGTSIDELVENTGTVASREGYTYVGLSTKKGDASTQITSNYKIKDGDTLYVLWRKENAVNVESVSINKTELTLHAGSSETLTATVLPENADDKSVTWSSSDPSVAKVDANGKVTAVADTGIADPASAVITVTTNDGKYTASCTVTVEDPVNAFVRRLYLLCFGRKADSGGFNMWTSGLRTRKYTAAFVVQAFFTSNEMKNMKLANEEWVERCYLVMMNRASDAGGKKGWVNKLEIGMSQTYVLRGFVGSTEFNNVCKDYGVERGSVTISEPRDQNQGITEFVGRCYSEVLGRKAEVGGLNDWCKRILTASNRKQAAIDAASNGFFHSPEYMNKHTNNDQYVRTLYRTFLGREADQGGYNNWMKALNSGTSRDDVMKGFANSTEFAKIMAKYGIK